MNPILSIFLFELVSAIICFTASIILYVVLRKHKDRLGTWYDCLYILLPLLAFAISTVVFAYNTESPDEYHERKLNEVRNTRFECMTAEKPTIACLQKYQLFLEDSVRMESLYGDSRREQLLKRIDRLHETEEMQRGK